MKPRYLFFTMFLWLSFPGRFFSLYYAAFGLSPSQIGLMFSLSSLCTAVTASHFGTLADRSASRPRFVFLLVCMSSIIFFLQTLAIPSLGLIPDGWRFRYLLFCSLGLRMFLDNVVPTVNSIAVATLLDVHGPGGHTKLPTERVAGAFSWGIGSLVFGVLLDVSPLGMWTIFPLFALNAAVFAASLLAFDRAERARKVSAETALLDMQADNQCRGYEAAATGPPDPQTGPSSSGADSVIAGSSPTDATVPETPSVPTVLRHVLQRAGLHGVLCLNLIFVLSCGMTLVTVLVFLFFANDLHASNTVCGLSVVITVVFEIPLFLILPELLRERGEVALMATGAAAYVVRAVVYAVAPNAWVVLCLEPLHGVTFALVNMASISYITERSPRGMESSAQAALFTLRRLGRVVGEGFGGWVMDSFGARVLYGGMAFAVAAAAALPVAWKPGATATKSKRAEAGEEVVRVR